MWIDTCMHICFQGMLLTTSEAAPGLALHLLCVSVFCETRVSVLLSVPGRSGFPAGRGNALCLLASVLLPPLIKG